MRWRTSSSTPFDRNRLDVLSKMLLDVYGIPSPIKETPPARR